MGKSRPGSELGHWRQRCRCWRSRVTLPHPSRASLGPPSPLREGKRIDRAPRFRPRYALDPGATPLTSTALSADLDWRRANPDADPADLRERLERLRAWKARHDEDRAQQPGPFLKLAWDAVFGDEDERVTQAIGELEAALARA